MSGPRHSQSLLGADTPAPATPNLCTACSELIFSSRSSLRSSSNPFAPAQRIILGTLEQILSRPCPFCAVVSHAIFEMRRVTPLILEPDQPVGVWWVASTGLPGFSVIFQGQGHSQGTVISAVASNPRLRTPPPPFSPPACLREIQTSEINIPRIQTWMQCCEDEHESCNLSAAIGTPIASVFPGLEVLRLIDVRDGRVTETRQFCRYLTLSYVWGNTASPRLTRANKAILGRPGGLRAQWSLLARTIRDAIDLVEKLGERFLWVDSLCLMQNDAEDVRTGTTVMDLIYEQSSLTIIAASGHDANAGLPGVHPGTRCPSQQLRDIGEGVKMGVHTTLTDLLKTSVYSTRGWTYQEQHLSRRSLYFINNQVFFKCGSAAFSEDTLDSVSRRVPQWELGRLQDQSSSPWAVAKALHEYSCRTLKYESDALRAISGIMRRMSDSMKCTWFQGGPTAFFDQTVLFSSPDLLRRRRGFPSYSWAGWTGRISFEPVMESRPGDKFEYQRCNRWLNERTWIIWYSKDGDRRTRLVWDPSRNRDFPLQDHSFVGYRERQRLRVRSPDYEFDSTGLETAPSRGWMPSRPMPGYPILRFWTMALQYKVRMYDSVLGFGYIIDRADAVSGVLRIDGHEETTAFESERPFEFILLSAGAYGTVQPLFDKVAYSMETELRRHSSAERFYVLCVEWEGGIAERRGLGAVEMEALPRSFSPGPVWKEIFLA
ncbi:heterokaryon incompatibility protein-domain-containing protein [Echria macrotheca]|uniref:Heterokaryon incompatibility protein-domain-containing protein n=1 Tax=Echria macrotheca TaxID=438768 RepID=A0AAJ0BGV1_9PEZI|nr:heterokaryon incompatibility protein-domain-containing protein [Echria macrotheca]